MIKGPIRDSLKERSNTVAPSVHRKTFGKNNDRRFFPENLSLSIERSVLKSQKSELQTEALT